MKKITLASLLATMMGTSPVWATGSTTATPTAATTAQVQKGAADVLQVAVQGANVIHDVRLARLALFHGQPENTKKLTDNAAALLTADNASQTKSVKTGATVKMITDRYVVVSATVALSKDYMATPGKENAIKSTDEKLAKGDRKGAIDTLRLAGIDVIKNQYLMPFNQTRKAVTQAQKLLKTEKYYEANLVLEGTEEGIAVDSGILVAGN